mmetsp:Transcript_62924/g.195266  ORF Transcript_62924/g.195266 Transcript_62924/m.195266 type:complete len:716 (-) Transcript_62924:7-2154(-)
MGVCSSSKVLRQVREESEYVSPKAGRKQRQSLAKQQQGSSILPPAAAANEVATKAGASSAGLLELPGAVAESTREAEAEEREAERAEAEAEAAAASAEAAEKARAGLAEARLELAEARAEPAAAEAEPAEARAALPQGTAETAEAAAEASHAKVQHAAADAGPPPVPAPVPASDPAPAVLAVPNAAQVPAESVLRLVPVRATEAEMPELFRKYTARVADRLTQTLNCGWDKLAEALNATAGGACSPEWYWVAPPGEDRPSAEDAHGLVVYRLVKGSLSSNAQVLHLSAAGPQWESSLPCLLQALRADVFERLPVGGVRASLFYCPDEAGKLALDTPVEKIFKANGFRWFQLTNFADGRRAQVMESKRRELDPPRPEELYDISVRLVSFVPSLGECGGEAEPVPAEHPASEDAGATIAVAGNPLCTAECLRRHTDLGNPESGEAGDGVMAVLAKLRKSGDRDLPLFWSKEATELQEVGRLVDECFGGPWAGDLAEDVMRQLGALRGEGPRPQFDSVMCAGTSVLKDWRLRHLQEASPEGLRVPVNAMGASPLLEDPIAYLATDDEAAFVIAWPVPRGREEDATRDPFGHCCEVLRSATPMVEPLPYDVMLLPRFRQQRFARSGHAPPRTSARLLHAPWEGVAVELSGGRGQPGALRPAEPEEPQRVCVLERPFALCLWHTRLDHLDLPLFATVVSESDCLPADGPGADGPRGGVAD